MTAEEAQAGRSRPLGQGGEQVRRALWAFFVENLIPGFKPFGGLLRIAVRRV